MEKPDSGIQLLDEHEIVIELRMCIVRFVKARAGDQVICIDQMTWYSCYMVWH